LHSARAVEGERKQVTVLFADIRRSLETQEHLDPEQWHDIMSRFFDFVTAEVHRHGGTINQYTGDGFMALFGAPIAHEDHARRACYASIDLRAGLQRLSVELARTAAIEFSVRIGLNSGEVIVGKIGDDLRMDYTAQGHTVGLAKRIEESAEPNSVYISEHTARLVDGYCRYEDMGIIHVRGIGVPVRLFRLADRIELRSRFDLAVQRGLTRFVGRTTELDVLEETLTGAIAGRGSTVAISGDGGIGKSRLCYEFAERCRSRGLPMAYGQAFDHGDEIPFLTALELLREIFTITTADPPAQARARIASVFPATEPEVAERLSLLFEFMGVTDHDGAGQSTDPVDRNRQLLGVIREVIHHRGLQGPLLILLEDLHWLDEGSAAVVEAIVRGAHGTRILFLCNFRPSFRADWLGELACSQVTLAPLDANDSRELARILLGDDGPVELAAFVGERAGGSPFFAEEIVRSLTERHTSLAETGGEPSAQAFEDIAIPPRVESLLAARIDRLSDSAKSVLQDAAVVGRIVPRDLLAQVSQLEGAALDAATSLLTQGGFIRKAIEGDTYAFVHPLTHAVAYRTQLAAMRQRRHFRTAAALEASGAVVDRPGESAALLAHHWEKAGHPLRAAQAGARLARWLVTSDVRRSFAQWSKVRNLAANLAESEISMTLTLRACAAMLRFGWRQGLQPAEAERLFEQSRGIARRLGDVRTETLLISSYGRMMGTIDSAEVYLRHASEAARLSARLNDPTLHLVVDVVQCQALGWVGRLGDSLALAEDILTREQRDVAAAVRYLGFSASVWARATRGWLLTELGRLAEGNADLLEAMRKSREEGQLDILPMASLGCVSLQWILDDVDAAMSEASAAVARAERLGSPYALVGAYWGLGRALLMQGRGEEAAVALKRALSIANDRIVYLESEGSMLALLAEAERAGGDLARSRALAERAVATARRRGMRMSEAEALLSLSRVLLSGGDESGWEAASGALRRALEIVDQNRARPLKAFLSVELAEVARMRRDVEGARMHREQARIEFLAMSARRRAEAVQGDPQPRGLDPI
jgi:adenylate cyclase